MVQFDFESLLKETMGLDAASVGSATIEGAVRLRMSSTGLKQIEDYWERLRASDDELQELIEAVVVPETWFFRDRDAFTTLGRLVSEEWLPDHPTQLLRLLSVPCCTGEEPYSIVMTLLEAGLPREKLKVDAVDISVRALVRAKRGVYGPNSFRGDNLTFRDRYFQQTPNGYSLPGPFRDMVTFHHGNLLSPDFRVGNTPYDVIFCRNVLIYFDRGTQERVMKLLHRLLTPSGFLFVGPSETFLATCTGFKSTDQTMSFAFRKADGQTIESNRTAKPSLKGVIVGIPRKQHIHQTAKRSPLSAPAQPLPLRVPAAPQSNDLARAKHLADAGRLQEAGELCETDLKEQGPSSEAYYLLGLVRDVGGDVERAAECYRKVLYLEPSHAEALAHLALLSEKQGDASTAQRLRERARRTAKGVGC